jgi:hypothetical protein
MAKPVGSTDMNKILVSVTVATIALVSAATATARVYDYTVTEPGSSDVLMSGQFTTQGNEVTGLTGSVSAGAYGFSPTGAVSLVADPGGVQATSTSGYFYYDDVYDGSVGHNILSGFDNNGLLFLVHGVEYNLFSNGSNPYLLYNNQGQNEAVNFSVGVPEPTTWALMLIGFGGMGVALRRSRQLAFATAA